MQVAEASPLAGQGGGAGLVSPSDSREAKEGPLLQKLKT